MSLYLPVSIAPICIAFFGKNSNFFFQFISSSPSYLDLDYKLMKMAKKSPSHINLLHGIFSGRNVKLACSVKNLGSYKVIKDSNFLCCVVAVI